MKVQCPSCKKLCHETTDTYNPDVRPNGGMVELLEPWKGWGWGKFGDYRNGGPEVMASDMECPCCESPLAPSGRLTVVEDDYQAIPKPPTLEEKNQSLIDDVWVEEAAEIPAEVWGRIVVEDVVVVSQELSDAYEKLSEKDGPKPLDCPECGWQGKTEPALKRHMTMVHK